MTPKTRQFFAARTRAPRRRVTPSPAPPLAVATIVPVGRRCQCCEIRQAEHQSRFCRDCANQIQLERSTRAHRLNPTLANRHGYLNGYSLGTFCPVRFEAPKPRYVARDGRGAVELQVVWNGA